MSSSANFTRHYNDNISLFHTCWFQRLDNSGTCVRGEIHMLLVGDPGIYWHFPNTLSHPNPSFHTSRFQRVDDSGTCVGEEIHMLLVGESGIYWHFPPSPPATLSSPSCWFQRLDDSGTCVSGEIHMLLVGDAGIYWHFPNTLSDPDPDPIISHSQFLRVDDSGTCVGGEIHMLLVGDSGIYWHSPPPPTPPHPLYPLLLPPPLMLIAEIRWQLYLC